MAFNMERIGDVYVLTLMGEVWGGWDKVDIKETMGRLLEEGWRKFLFDLSQPDYVNSVGIGILVSILVTSKRSEARLGLCSVSERTRRALDVTGIGRLFECFDNRDEGIRALGGGTSPATRTEPAAHGS